MIGFYVNFFHILRTHFREEFKNPCGKTVLKSWVSSSNVNKVIRAVLNLFIYLFFTKRFHAHKHKDATKQKHKRHRDTKAKAQKCK